MKIEQLLPYMTHGLQIKILNHECDYVGIEYSVANGYYMIGDRLHITYNGGSTGKDIDTFKPILRPMSDLNDSDLMKEWRKEHSIEYNMFGLQLKTHHALCINILGYPVEFLNDLYREHFDIHDLISKGLAISIHDLEK